jgi:uracil-DNA glycosylase
LSSEKKNAANSHGHAKIPRDEPASVTGLAVGIGTLLRFHRQMGIDSYPLTSSLRQSLQKITEEEPKTVHKSAVSRGRPGVVAPSSDAEPAWTSEARVDRLRLLHNEVETCSLCRLAEAGQGRSSGGDVIGMPSLLIVGDYCGLDVEMSEDSYFGAGEDVMLWNMMRAIGLTPEQVFVTNVIKCRVPAALHPDADSHRRCRPFLHREIELIRPRVICTMGEMAAQALLGDRAPLLRLRGRRHQFNCGDDRSGMIPVIVTFHPRFLHQHPDMKKAAWEDLQKVRKCLATTAIS